MVRVEEHLGLVRRCVNLTSKAWYEHYTFEEMVQTGTLFLMDACEKFDESLGYKFSTFAVPVIKYGILRAIRDDKSIYLRRGEKLKISSLNIVIKDSEKIIEVQDTLSDGIDHENEIINKILVDKLLSSLDERDREIVKLYYFDSLSQVQISKLLDICQVQISRILKKSITKMRRSLDVAS